MIYVAIEYWPGGDEAKKELIGTAQISNVSGLANISDYACRVLIEGHCALEILPTNKEFTIRRHVRKDGIAALLARVFAFASYRGKDL